ncbi:MAG: NAD(P)/FAD-dependent oxidoreductase [Ilumatobacteraceae bacterium]
MSGILAGHRLAQAGVSYEIIEKHDDVAGTWLVNTYPGCRVDNPNHNYSYSFAQRHDWPFHFSTQDVLRDYFRECAREFGVDQHVRFGSEVVSATWDEPAAQWVLTIRRSDGSEATERADAVISAVGQLSRPKLPDIEGRESFAGEWFHSAQWNPQVDLAGKKVVVIGTGASALQFLPIIAPECGTLAIFQRTAPWLAPTPDYHEPVPAGLSWLYRNLPGYSEFNRFSIFWRMGDGALEGVRVEDGFPHRPDAVGVMNDFVRELLTQYLRAEFADRPDLLEHVIPNYPVGAKRGIRDNGAWAATLKRDNVRLVTDGIERIEPGGVRTATGELVEAEVLIYGSGFEASKFLEPITITGRAGLDLHEQWEGDARAYLGVAMPGFPNFFCLYGPNTNIVLNGSIIYFSECGTRLILGLLGRLARTGARSIEIRRDVHDAFNEASDAANLKWAWGWSEVSSWYKNDRGRSATNWAFTLLEYWQRTLAPVPEEWVLGD